MTTAFSYRQRSFTLIELMVALALASIMMSAIVFVFTQSQQVMSAMDAKVIVYNYARSAFDVMEKDLANAQKTGDMEFFQDGTSSPGLIGHYDGLLSGLDAEAIPVRDRGATPHELFPNEKYVYAMTLHQPEPYTDVLGVKHRHDSLYFRSVTSINGLTRPVLIEYALDHSKSSGAPRKLARLVRRTWIVTKIESSGLAGRPRIELNGGAGPNVGPNEPIESELCLYVTDVQIELFFQDKRTNKPGLFLSAEELVKGTKQTRPAANIDIMMRDFDPSPQGYKVSCFYDHRYNERNGDIGDKGIYLRSRDLMSTQLNFHFPMLEPGDRMVIFNSNVPAVTNRDVTIRSIERAQTSAADTGLGGGEFWGVRFQELLPSNLTADPQFQYRVGFLPAMVRVTLKIKDERAKAIRTLVRQFKLLGA